MKITDKYKTLDFILGFNQGRDFERKKTLNWLKNFDLRRQAVGALKSAINDHGPITKELIGSAAKRVNGMLKQERKKIIKKYEKEMIAQLAEQDSYKVQVDGSSPSHLTYHLTIKL